MTNEKSELKELAAAIRRGEVGSAFKGTPVYDRRNDSILAFHEQTASVAQRVDSFLTVFISRQTKKLVGVQFKQVSKLAAACAKRGSPLKAGEKLYCLVDEYVTAEFGQNDVPYMYYLVRGTEMVHEHIPDEVEALGERAEFESGFDSDHEGFRTPFGN